MLLRRHRRTTIENVQPSEMAVANVFKEVEEVPKVTKTTKKEGGTSGRGRSKAKA